MRNRESQKVCLLKLATLFQSSSPTARANSMTVAVATPKAGI
ncbi:Uncharacterised protein [Streptococcus pneumoniae]|nr:Uncharacterised protein [Streptococcus pneumoniae]CIW07321.1 Uncharacterised protein [Streptococcus pneumoniae]